MKRTSVRAVLLCLAVVATLVLAAAPAGAVIGGQQDIHNTYGNVGLIEVHFEPYGPEDWGFVGTCTLVDEDVVLTAAHCVDWVIAPGGPGIDNIRVTTFDPLIDPVFPLYDGDAHYVQRIEVHPDYLTAPSAGLNSMRWIGPGHEDVALMWFTEPVTGITPAKIVAADGLKALDLKNERFTVVGYGINGFVKGSAMSWRNPQAYALWSGRNYKEVSVLSTHEVFADRYLMIESSIAFGDSGGPLFYGTVVVADTVWVESMRCESPAYEYRLDAPRAQWFLHTWLDEDRFIGLQ